MSKKEQVVEEAIEKNNEVDDGEELSPWYYFFSQGCGWCKKATPVVEELNSEGKHPEVLLLDTAEPDNAKLRDELFSEYKTSCGTPFFINADTGESVCGFREKDVLEKWLAGESIPAPPRVTGPPPKIPFHGSTDEENVKWKESYDTWLTDNEHMPEDWQKKQKSSDEIIDNPRPKNDPPMLPNLAQASESQIEDWGAKLKTWQEENDHIPNQQDPDKLVTQFKSRVKMMQQQQQRNNQQGGANLSPDQDARLQRLEQKVDKLIKHLGVK